MKKYVVRLDIEERERLQRLVRPGRAAACKIRRARTLLMAVTHGPGRRDEQDSEGLGVSLRQIEHLRKLFVEQGIDA